eukprot:SM000091S24587  [mRNA]  locus=s91:134592:135677:- [translate_table: standard]
MAACLHEDAAQAAAEAGERQCGEKRWKVLREVAAAPHGASRCPQPQGSKGHEGRGCQLDRGAAGLWEAELHAEDEASLERQKASSGTSDQEAAQSRHGLGEEGRVASAAQRAEAEVPDWEVDADEIDLKKGKLVGKGAFGVIYKVMWRGTPVAVKMMLPSLSNDEQLV